MKENRDDPELKRKGIYTSGIVSIGEERQIVLFFSGREHAGENLDKVLKHRNQEMGKIIQMEGPA